MDPALAESDMVHEPRSGDMQRESAILAAPDPPGTDIRGASRVYRYQFRQSHCNSLKHQTLRAVNLNSLRPLSSLNAEHQSPEQDKDICVTRLQRETANEEQLITRVERREREDNGTQPGVVHSQRVVEATLPQRVQ